MKSVAYLLIGTLVSLAAFGTEQFAERILVDGQNYALLSFPLEKYFYKHPKKRPGLDATSTALYRGYIGHYAIADSKLIIRDVIVPSASRVDEWDSVVGRLFPTAEDRLLTFFTGLLVIPMSPRVERIPRLSDIAKYRLIAVRMGDVVADRIFSVDEYKEYLSMNESLSGKTPRPPEVSKKAWAEGKFPIYLLHNGHVEERLVDYKEFRPNKPVQPTPGSVTPRAPSSASK